MTKIKCTTCALLRNDCDSVKCYRNGVYTLYSEGPTRDADKQIFYKSGYKYQLAKEFKFSTDIIGYTYDSDFLSLTTAGTIIAKVGYCWDGPSGPMIDTDSAMRPSLAHDCGYELLRNEAIPSKYREYFDDLFLALMKEDGVSDIRAHYAHFAVDKFAASAANPTSRKEILTAP